MTVASPGFPAALGERRSASAASPSSPFPPTARRQGSQVFNFHLLLQLSSPSILTESRVPTFGLTDPGGGGVVLFEIPISGEGAWRGRMKNSVPLLCFWSVYCCFAAGSPTPFGPEGRLEGNVHLYLLPPPHFFSVLGPLCLADPSLVPPCFYEILLPFPLRCPFFSSTRSHSLVLQRF